MKYNPHLRLLVLTNSGHIEIGLTCKENIDANLILGTFQGKLLVPNKKHKLPSQLTGKTLRNPRTTHHLLSGVSRLGAPPF